MSSISDELRKMLDERNIKYECYDKSDKVYQYECTEWGFKHGDAQFIEYPDSTVMSISIYVTNPTPEQAIAAALNAERIQSD